MDVLDANWVSLGRSTGLRPKEPRANDGLTMFDVLQYEEKLMKNNLISKA